MFSFIITNIRSAGNGVQRIGVHARRVLSVRAVTFSFFCNYPRI
eukprot:SAG31_NODE_45862_length_257_cov_0.639241_1_plen_43_part_01